jgi:plastocyanin
MRRLLVSVLAAVGVAVAAGCGGSPKSAAPPATVAPNSGAVVVIKNIAFSPQTVTISAGQTVVWKFDDGGVAHNVTFDGFRSPDRTSGTYQHTFTTPGVYKYQCTIHSGMDGTVIVK